MSGFLRKFRRERPAPDKTTPAGQWADAFLRAADDPRQLEHRIRELRVLRVLLADQRPAFAQEVLDELRRFDPQLAEFVGNEVRR